MKRSESGKGPAAPKDPMLGQLVAEKWRVLERLEDVGRAHAYKAERSPTGETARIDLPQESLAQARGELARFDREARIASQIKHPGCATILAFGAWRERPFLVTELVRGTRLIALVGTPELTVKRAVATAVQLLEAVRHMHAYGVVHRDLSLEGIALVDSQAGEQAKLGPPGLGMPGTGALAGFGSPEEATAHKGDQRGDVLALGMILYAMCVGELPAQARPFPEPRKAAPQREISEGLERVIAKATARIPESRFQSASEFLAALLGVEGVPRPTRPVAPRRLPSPSPVTIAWGVAAVVAVVGTGVVISSARTGRQRAEELAEDNGEAPEKWAPSRVVAMADPPGRAPSQAPAPPSPSQQQPTPAPAQQAPAPPSPSQQQPPPPPAQQPTSPPQPPQQQPASPPAPPPPPPPPPPPSPPPAPPHPPPHGRPQPPPEPPKPVPPPKPAPPPLPTRPPPPPPLPPTPPPPPPLPTKPAPPADLRPGASPHAPAVRPAVTVVELVPISDAERAEVLALISRRETLAANEKITALMQRDPRVAWPHVALAELHMRNLWRRDVVRQWLTALRLDPTLKDDRRLANHLCVARGAKWDAAGIAELWSALGERAGALREARSTMSEPTMAAAHAGGNLGGTAGAVGEAVAHGDGPSASEPKAEDPTGASVDANPGTVPDAGPLGAGR